MHGPIFSVASDGYSSFWKMRQILCMKTEIDPSSELRKIVCPLLGMNTCHSTWSPPGLQVGFLWQGAQPNFCLLPPGFHPIPHHFTQ